MDNNLYFVPTKNIDYLEHLLFAAYLVFFAWLITKIKFFTKSGLTPAQLIIFFLLKVMAGIFYGWIGVYYGELAQMIDTWAYHYESLKEYDLLINSPSEFFSSLFHSPYQSGYGRFLASENSWWNDLKGNSLLKVLAFFNVLSFGNYYINLIFYSFLTLFGPIAIYRIMKEVFPNKKDSCIDCNLPCAFFFILDQWYSQRRDHICGFCPYHLSYIFRIQRE